MRADYFMPGCEETFTEIYLVPRILSAIMSPKFRANVSSQ